MNKNEIFKKSTTHLIKQGKQALDGKCMYRSRQGLQCAIGCLIRDEDYDPMMEGREVSWLKRHDLLPDYLNVDLVFLSDLQDLHDEHFKNGINSRFLDQMKNIADTWEIPTKYRPKQIK